MLNTKEGKTKKEIEKCPWIALWIHLSPSYIRTEENDDDMNHKERVGGGHLHCTGWVGGRFAFRSHTACQFGILLTLMSRAEESIWRVLPPIMSCIVFKNVYIKKYGDV